LVSIDAVLDGAGILASCRVHGHAGAGKRGGDIVCAAVSVLLRAACRTLSGRKGITVRGEAPERGVLWIEADYTAEGRDFLFAAGAYLLEGLSSVAEEYPNHCTLSITGGGKYGA
jgi:uncharacterized protein YsxB (DUF464 family)